VVGSPDSGNKVSLNRRSFLTGSGALVLGVTGLPWAIRGGEDTPAAIASNPDLRDPRTTLPRTVKRLEEGIRNGLHVGAQMFVSVAGKPRADFGLGESRPGVAMTPDSLMVWYSMTKAVTAVAVAQQWERGKLDLDDPVVKYIPEFGQNGKERVTIRHVLTHTGGFPRADARVALSRPFAEVIATICAAKLEDGWVPGKKAAYHPTSGWYILGELVRRIDQRPFDRYVREEIFEPLGMKDCWVGMPAEQFRAYGDRVGLMMNTWGEAAVPATRPEVMEVWCGMCVPGANGHGPMRELGWFYEMLLFGGQRGGVRILSPQSVAAITAYHRIGLVDGLFKTAAPWGLGFSLDNPHYGRYHSPRTFGHGGSLSSEAYCDPEYGLVVAVVCNGRPTNDKHRERFAALSSALYEDLGLAQADELQKTGENRAN
jgi:CubicO group peptidase (beta-lactamase class C family)